MDDGWRRGERIAASTDRLRSRGVNVERSAIGREIRYEARRNAYRLSVIVDPRRFIGLEFDLLAEDGSVLLGYAVDTDLYDISRPAFAALAMDVESDIVLFLDALADGRILLRRARPPSMIVPTADGLRVLRRARFGMTTGGPYRDGMDVAARSGFVPVPP
ncbi:hypothetical protein ACFY4C_27500 [Actinomadura viridis]|uniref:hypothetical protein n=1 Tax=Actinomadura viridis TaxID=58110 RepID=UPI0036AE40A2